MVEEGSAVQALPNLEPLCSLTALNLSENRLTTIPASLTRLTDLRYIDLATNRGLKARLYSFYVVFGAILADVELAHA